MAVWMKMLAEQRRIALFTHAGKKEREKKIEVPEFFDWNIVKYKVNIVM